MWLSLGRFTGLSARKEPSSAARKVSLATKPPQKTSSSVRRAGTGSAVMAASKTTARARHVVEQEDMVPWSQVQQLMATMQDVLRAKTSVSYELEHEAKVLHEKEEHLMFESLRADEDSGCLRAELEKLIRAKAQLMQEKAELERQNAFLQSERHLLCQQLQVDPCTANLCQEVAGVLVEARRVPELEMQLGETQLEAARLEEQLAKAQQQHEQQRGYWAQQQAELWGIIRGHDPLSSALPTLDEDTAMTPAAAAADLTLAIKPLDRPLDPLLDLPSDLLTPAMQHPLMDPTSPSTYIPVSNLVMGSSSTLTKLLSARKSDPAYSTPLASNSPQQEPRRCGSVGTELSSLLRSLDDHSSSSQAPRRTYSTPAISIKRVSRSPSRSAGSSGSGLKLPAGEAKTAAVQLLSCSPGMDQPRTPVADSAPLIKLFPLSPSGSHSSPAFKVDWQLA